MQISISGSTGFIGQELVEKFRGTDITVNPIDRDSLGWDDETFIRKKIEGSDVIINLAGAPVIHRWTDNYKKEIYHSRIDTTRKIVRSIEKADVKPKLLISSSAIGIYDPIHEHTETSSLFSGDFLGTVCRDWEAEALRAEPFTRVVILRTGVVLGTEGGALAKMYKFFSFGLGGKTGNGQQHFSWIHIRDFISVFQILIHQDQISGIVNGVAPNPTTNAHFSEVFGKVLAKPALFTIPPFALRTLYGEGAETLLKGQRVLPEKLLQNKFDFQYPTIESALLNLFRI